MESAQEEIRFDGKVVVVTGAAAGLGRAYAILFAEKGAKVVVNGKPGGKSLPELVVEEITKSGGTAVADHNSVENGSKIIQTALDSFGKIDIVVNNAGISKNLKVHEITEEIWNDMINVNLKGTFEVSKAAFAAMKAQGHGKIITTTSSIGLYGGADFAHYASAKAGVVGLTCTLAHEGAAHNIQVNCISPIARTNMTEMFYSNKQEWRFNPEQVAPLVAYLAHDSCKETGAVYEIGAGWISKARWQRSEGANFDLKKLTPEKIRDNIEKIQDFSNPAYPKSHFETLQCVSANAKRHDEGADEEARSKLLCS